MFQVVKTLLVENTLTLMGGVWLPVSLCPGLAFTVRSLRKITRQKKDGGWQATVIVSMPALEGICSLYIQGFQSTWTDRPDFPDLSSSPQHCNDKLFQPLPPLPGHCSVTGMVWLTI